MKKVTMGLLLVLCVSSFSYSQTEKKMKDEDVVAGTIYKNGGELQGYIKKMGSRYLDGNMYPAPWEFQGEIKFIPKDVFEKNEKIKNKFYEKYGPKDCDGYKYDTLIYESVKYADMSAVGMNMLPKKVFMKKILESKISLFHYFDTPPVVGVYQAGEYEKLLEECAKIHLVYRKDKNGKLKLVNDLNIEKELSDCPQVVEKQSKGEYKALGAEGKSSGLSKMINNSVFREQVRLIAIEDYNKNCK